MVYDRQIIRVFLEAGCDGLSVQKVALHVFNSCNSLFAPISFDDVYTYTQRFIRKNSTKPRGLLKRGTKRGVYILNPASPQTRQLRIDFNAQAEDDGQTDNSTDGDTSLSLF